MVLALGLVGDVGGRGEAYIVDVGILMILREEIVAAATVAVESTPSFQLGGTVATESGELVVVVSAAVMMMMMMMVTLTKVVLVQRWRIAWLMFKIFMRSFLTKTTALMMMMMIMMVRRM